MICFKDFEGQAKAEKISRLIITLFGAVGLIWGYLIQQFSQTVYILFAGFALAAIVCNLCICLLNIYYLSSKCLL